MIKLRALIDFHENINGRTNPIVCDSYHPLILVGENSFVSGFIKSDDKKKIYPGERIFIDLYVPSDHLMGVICENQVFTFWEPPIQIGEITVRNVQ